MDADTWSVEPRFFIKALFPVSQTVWFIPNYFILMLISPVLNAFCEQYRTKYILCLTLGIYFLSYFWSSVFSGTISGFGGYSWGWFIILYLTGRVIRRYTDTHEFNGYIFLVGYILATIIIVGIAIGQKYYPIGKSLLWNYDFPLVYMSSVCLFIFFVKAKIKTNKLINWLAASSFAVLLFHVAPFAHYNDLNKYIDQNTTGVVYFILCTLVVLSYYLITVLIDQIRIVIFRKIYTK